MYSRHAAERHLLDAHADDAAVLGVLTGYAGTGAVILACSDGWADFLSRQRIALEALGLHVVAPPGHVSEQLNDKATELELMSQVGVTLPRSLTRLSSDATEMMSALGDEIIIKPRSYAHASKITTKNVITRDNASLAAFIHSHREHLDSFVAQEIIHGPDESVWVCNCCFGEHGQLLSAFSFQRIRMSPPHFGVTTFAIGRFNQELVDACALIGRALKYVGPAMIEFKHNAVTGEYAYIETNPRIGMCNILDTRSDVNNVAAAYFVAIGDETRAAMPKQSDGVYFLNVYGDLYSRFSDGEAATAIFGSYMRTIGARHAWAYFDAGDPWPWLRATGSTFKEVSAAVGRRVRRMVLGGARNV